MILDGGMITAYCRNELSVVDAVRVIAEFNRQFPGMLVDEYAELIREFGGALSLVGDSPFGCVSISEAGTLSGVVDQRGGSDD